MSEQESNSSVVAESPAKKTLHSATALIKPEFINHSHKPRYVAAYLPESECKEIQHLVSLRQQQNSANPVTDKSTDPTNHIAPNSLLSCDSSEISNSVTNTSAKTNVEEEISNGSTNSIAVIDEGKSLQGDKDEEVAGFKRGADLLGEGDSGQPAKKAKLKGRNKKRPFEKRPANSSKLCSFVVAGKECRFGEKCKFSHDVDRFMGEKVAVDRSYRCYVFDTYGHCPFGMTCLFSKAHTAVEKDLSVECLVDGSGSVTSHADSSGSVTSHADGSGSVTSTSPEVSTGTTTGVEATTSNSTGIDVSVTTTVPEPEITTSGASKIFVEAGTRRDMETETGARRDMETGTGARGSTTVEAMEAAPAEAAVAAVTEEEATMEVVAAAGGSEGGYVSLEEGSDTSVAQAKAAAQATNSSASDTVTVAAAADVKSPDQQFPSFADILKRNTISIDKLNLAADVLRTDEATVESDTQPLSTSNRRSGIPPPRNVISKDLQIRLRKREVDFSRANRAIRQSDTRKSKKSSDEMTSGKEGGCRSESGGGGVAQVVVSNGKPSTEGATLSESALLSDNMGLESSKPLGSVSDGARLHTAEIKQIDFKRKLYLAPLTTVGNLPFRRLCKIFGADITCGEMAMPLNLLQGQASEWALLKRHQSEDLFGVQLCGSYVDTMTRTAQVISDHMDVDFIDINVGCPIDMVIQKGEGCALMTRAGRFEQIIRSMKSVMTVPLTVKMRTGMFENRNTAHTLLPRLAALDVSLTTLHGRSREQRYTRLADWQYITQCAEAAAPMPLFGNGDILSYEDYNRNIADTGVAGCMIARGALVKPWLFTEIKEQRHWDISSSERLDMIRTFCNYGLEHWGSDQQGVANTRRFLLEWLSFTHRYIPVGVLERVPQKINEKPPYYFGRNDLETLMASSNCADWIKISEMLLGPVPQGFTFLPKHRANSYA